MVSIKPVSTSVLVSSSSAESKLNDSSVVSSAYQQAATVGKGSTDTVSISGRAIMLSRLFNSDGSVEPKLEAAATTANTSGSVYNFLTKMDRDMLSGVYEYASKKGIDPIKVDRLAADLGIYRMAGAGGPADNAGQLYDVDGKPFIPQFNARDEAVAQRVLTSKAMSDSTIDRGFLEAIFSPTRMSVHASDFSFLEEIVYASSVSGSDGSIDPTAKPVIRYKAEDFPSLNLDSQAVESGSKTMLSRLLDKEITGNAGALGMESNNNSVIKLLDLLSSNDKEMLGKLYSIAQLKREDFSKIDDMAIMLGNYRKNGLGR